MKYKVIIGSAIVILGTGVIAAFAGVNRNSANQLQQNDVTRMPTLSPSRGASLAPTNKVTIQGQTFEIRGVIASVSGSTFAVDGKTITINPAKVVNFQQTTNVAVGNQVKVEGIVENGTLFAREIKSLAEDNRGRKGE